MNSVDKVVNKSYDTVVGGVELLDEAAECIRRGELVAFPTETVYGLGADAFNEEAVRNIFIAKGRPQDNPFIVHVASPKGAEVAVSHIPDAAYRLWEKFSPGPLTIVLPKSERMPLITTGGLNTVGIRIPNNTIALELIRRSGCAIAAPSANTSGRISPTRAMDVYEDMRGRIPLILDGGQTDVGIESTVIDLTREVPTVLRPGAITAEMLAEVLGEVVNHKGKVVVAAAPGMKYKHYAPVVPCIGARTPEAARKIASRFPSAVIMGESSFVKDIEGVTTVNLGATPEECMRNVFSEMRDAEKVYSCIVVEDFSEKPDFYALNNRLSKSTGGKTEE